MAIARVFDGKGWTPEQYDLLIKRMNLGRHAAPGVLYHWAASTPEGMRAVDVYESRDVADRLAQEKIGPLVMELQLPMPAITEFGCMRSYNHPVCSSASRLDFEKLRDHISTSGTVPGGRCVTSDQIEREHLPLGSKLGHSVPVGRTKHDRGRHIP